MLIFPILLYQWIGANRAEGLGIVSVNYEH